MCVCVDMYIYIYTYKIEKRVIPQLQGIVTPLMWYSSLIHPLFSQGPWAAPWSACQTRQIFPGGADCSAKRSLMVLSVKGWTRPRSWLETGTKKKWTCWIQSAETKCFIVGLVGFKLCFWQVPLQPSNMLQIGRQHPNILSLNNTRRAPRRSCLASQVKAGIPKWFMSAYVLATNQFPIVFPIIFPIFSQCHCKFSANSNRGNDDQPSIIGVNGTGCHLSGIIQEIHVGLAVCLGQRTPEFPSQIF